MRGRLLAIGFDRLARDRARDREGEHIGQVAIRLVEADHQRVAVGRLQAGHRRVVIEGGAGLGAGAEIVEPDDLAGEEEGVGRAVLRVEEAADRIGKVLRRELALLPLERRIVDEIDALLYPEGVGASIGRDLRHLRGARHELRRTREVVVGEQRVEDRFQHVAGVIVVDAYWVEARLCRLEGDAQDLAATLAPCAVQREERGDQDEARGGAHGAESIIARWRSFPGSTSSSPGSSPTARSPSASPRWRGVKAPRSRSPTRTSAFASAPRRWGASSAPRWHCPAT